jgi:hypothetical protein
MNPLPRALRVVKKYLQQLQAAGVSAADIEFAEESMIAEPGGKSEDELIPHIKAACAFMRDVAKRKGANL